MADQKTIWVKSTLPVQPDGGSEVAFYEQDAAHPNGQAWVAGPEPVEVAETGEVQAAIAAGRLEKVTATEGKQEAAEAEKTRQEAARRAGGGATPGRSPTGLPRSGPRQRRCSSTPPSSTITARGTRPSPT